MNGVADGFDVNEERVIIREVGFLVRKELKLEAFDLWVGGEEGGEVVGLGGADGGVDGDEGGGAAA